MIPTVLCIGGLDPSGGAGLSADIKTATTFGVYGMNVVTAVTVQHPGAVSRVAPIPANIVGEQLSCLIDNMPIGAIKIGMLCSTDIASTVTQIVSQAGIPIVIDPVTVSTSGTTLSDIKGETFERLIAQATVITPNSEEMIHCTGEQATGKWCIDNGVAILHTGGHTDSDPIVDTLWLPNGTHRRWSHPRVQTVHTHGSGCTISTAIAAGLAKGLDLVEACAQAIQFTTQVINDSAKENLVDNNGPLLHFKWTE